MCESFSLEWTRLFEIVFSIPDFWKNQSLSAASHANQATALTSKPNHLNVEEPKLNFCHWSFKFLRKQDKRKIFLWLTGPVKHDAMEAIRHWIKHQKFEQKYLQQVMRCKKCCQAVVKTARELKKLPLCEIMDWLILIFVKQLPKPCFDEKNYC